MSLNKKERYMGRPLRTRIDFAKTLSWYDFFHNQLNMNTDDKNAAMEKCGIFW